MIFFLAIVLCSAVNLSMEQTSRERKVEWRSIEIVLYEKQNKNCCEPVFCEMETSEFPSHIPARQTASIYSQITHSFYFLHSRTAHTHTHGYHFEERTMPHTTDKALNSNGLSVHVLSSSHFFLFVAFFFNFSRSPPSIGARISSPYPTLFGMCEYGTEKPEQISFSC